VGSQFYTNGNLDLAKIKEFPALLVTEPGGTGSQFAKVAHITNLTQGQKETSVQFAIDHGISPISNRDLENYPNELELGGFGLSHTCWSVCKADLYRLLLRNREKGAAKPKVFSLDEVNNLDENLVSVMMPFGAEFKPVYTAIHASITSMGFTCVRADDIWEHHAIIQDIANIIARANVVVCDCSGKNPNVFYEAGIAHAIGKEVILISQSENDVPFDLRHLRYIRYLPNNEGFAELTSSIQSRLRSIRGW